MAEAELIRNAGNLPGQQESSGRVRVLEGRQVRINSCMAASAEYAMYFTRRSPLAGIRERIDESTEEMFTAPQMFGGREDPQSWNTDIAEGNGISNWKLATWLNRRGIIYMEPPGGDENTWKENLRSWLRQGGAAIAMDNGHARCIVYDPNSDGFFEYEPNGNIPNQAERRDMSADFPPLRREMTLIIPPTRDRMSPGMRKLFASFRPSVYGFQHDLYTTQYFPETIPEIRFGNDRTETTGEFAKLYRQMRGNDSQAMANMLGAMTYDNHAVAEFRDDWINSGQLAATAEFLRRTPNEAVNFLYRFILGREPDLSGRANYSRRLQNGDNVNDVIREMQQSGEYRQKAIKELYRDLLGREADQGGLDDRLRSGRSVGQIAAEIRGSEEYRRLELADPDWPKFVLGSLAEHRGLVINDLVKDAFGTPKANMAVISSLVRGFMDGMAVAETRSLIAGLPNYQRRIAELAARSPEEAVRNMFRLVLGREADPEGLRGYSATIRRTNNPQAVLVELLHSEEYARMMINQLYHEILARDPDAGGLRDKAAAVRRGVPLGEIAAGMRGSEEYHNKTRPPGVSLHLENRATRARLRRGDGIFHYRRDA